MLRRLLRTTDDYALLIIRLALAISIFPHGAQKALGWFGGGGPAGTVDFMGNMGIPAPLAVLDIIAEFVGPLALVIGLLGRVAAAGIGAVLLVAALLVHAQNGFFMNWSGQQAGEGIEYHILGIAMALAIMLKGSGALSVDLALTRNAFVGSESAYSRGTPAGAAR
jgi:putative oxidoreductase